MQAQQWLHSVACMRSSGCTRWHASAAVVALGGMHAQQWLHSVACMRSSGCTWWHACAAVVALGGMHAQQWLHLVACMRSSGCTWWHACAAVVALGGMHAQRAAMHSFHNQYMHVLLLLYFGILLLYQARNTLHCASWGVCPRGALADDQSVSQSVSQSVAAAHIRAMQRERCERCVAHAIQTLENRHATPSSWVVGKNRRFCSATPAELAHHCVLLVPVFNLERVRVLGNHVVTVCTHVCDVCVCVCVWWWWWWW
jgi:hypothetical protein